MTWKSKPHRIIYQFVQIDLGSGPVAFFHQRANAAFHGDIFVGKQDRSPHLLRGSPALQSSHRNDLTRQGRAGILAVPNAFDATHGSGT